MGTNKDCLINAETFIGRVNLLRQKNKGQWIALSEIVDGKMVEYKAFGTWIQILRIDGVNHSSPMGMNVKQYIQHLNNAFQTV